jgi:TfoX/Sxy family transcriptional regulator of competence genes
VRWSAPSQELLELLEESLRHVSFERKKMFGQYALFHRGNMFCGVFEETVFIRYPPEKQDSLFEEFDEIGRFEPLEGRAMKEYVTVPDSVFSNPEVRNRLLQACIAFVSKLPSKS